MEGKKIDRIKMMSWKIVGIISILWLGLTCSKITAPADIEAPKIPANFTFLGGGDGQAHFRWSRNQEPDFNKYNVYRSVNTTEQFTKISETEQSEFVDRFLAYEWTYYYYITAIDYAGNESAPTATVDVHPVNISSPPTPRSVTVNGNNYPAMNQILFSIGWLSPDISDLWKYRIYKGNTADFTADALTLYDSTALSIYYDRNIKIGDIYFYRIVSVDLGGKISAPSGAMGDIILEQVELKSPSNRIEFAAPYDFSWNPVLYATDYQIFVGRAPLTEVIWTSGKTKATKVTYSGSSFTAGSIYYWWVGTYSKDAYIDDNGSVVSPEVNSYSDIWSFFIQ